MQAGGEHKQFCSCSCIEKVVLKHTVFHNLLLRVHQFDTVLQSWLPADSSLDLPLASNAFLDSIGGEVYAVLAQAGLGEKVYRLAEEGDPAHRWVREEDGAGVKYSSPDIQFSYLVRQHRLLV